MKPITKNQKTIGFEMTDSEFISHDRNYDGACLSCGKTLVGGVEPDARNHECELCGENRVFGFQELLVNGRIKIIE